MMFELKEKFLCRIPLLSLQDVNYIFLQDHSDIDAVSKYNYLQKISQNPIIMEMLYLNSENLYTDFLMLLKKDNTNEEKIDKIFTSVKKYITRSTTRCTPFGISAGVLIGEFDKYIRNVDISDISNIYKYLQNGCILKSKILNTIGII